MTGASMVARSTIETSEQVFTRQYGTADVVVFVGTDPFGVESTVIPTLPDLPDGTSTTTFFSAYTDVRALIDGDQVSDTVRFTDIDLRDPITRSVVDVSAGRVPSGPGEALISTDVAERFGVGVGDPLRLIRPGLELTVVGLGQDRSWVDGPLMVVSGFDRELLQKSATEFATLVDLPDSLSEDERAVALDSLVSTGQGTLRSDEPFFYDNTGVSARQLAWGWVAGVLGFVAVGIVIAAAFATSARRQLVTIGQLASNGAAPRLVRRTMALQGMWTGVLGVAVGLPLGVGSALFVRDATLLDRIARRPIDNMRFSLSDLAVIAATAVVAATIAALVPARSAAKIPVLSALAGRRPVAEPPRWLAPLGVASFLIGLLLLAAAAAVEGGGDLIALVAVFGGLAVVFGMVCASPLIVNAVSAVGSRRGGVVRLAARSLGRSRARSAAVLTAIATVGTIAVIASTVVASSESLDRNVDTGDDFVEVSYVFDLYGIGAPDDVDDDGIVDPEPVIASPLPDDVRSDIERILPDATWTPISRVVHDPAPYIAQTGEPVEREGFEPDVSDVFGAVLVDDAVRAVAEFNGDQLAELERTGVLVLSPYLGDEIAIATTGDSIPVDVSGSMRLLGVDGPFPSAQVENSFDESRRQAALQIADVFVSPRFVDENGLTLSLSTYLLDNTTDITRGEFDQLNQIRSAFQDDAFVPSASAPGFEQDSDGFTDAWFVNSTYPSTPVPWTLIRIAVAAASLVLVLAVVAIGLSLAASESRDERDVLLAVGASPSTLRRVAAAKAWVLTTGAGLTAVPVGYVTIYVIMEAIGANDLSAPFPFAIAVGLVVVIPAVAWVVTFATSGLAQRLRPVTYSTLATD
ncbi:MAG: FtsX-like permease family protein [Ilumatobacter sp.]|uniref:FtsX-like permease family protein n=1 Tax=Ilumatobacter sp. TaxID=1967498 RepID=UPI003C763EC6